MVYLNSNKTSTIATIGSTTTTTTTTSATTTFPTTTTTTTTTTTPTSRHRSRRRSTSVGVSIIEAFQKQLKPKELDEILRLEYRSKLLNPKWYDLNS